MLDLGECSRGEWTQEDYVGLGIGWELLEGVKAKPVEKRFPMANMGVRGAGKQVRRGYIA